MVAAPYRQSNRGWLVPDAMLVAEREHNNYTNFLVYFSGIVL